MSKLDRRCLFKILQISLLEGPEVYLAVALAFLRLHEGEILNGNDIADVVNVLDVTQTAMYEVDVLLLQVLAHVGHAPRYPRYLPRSYCERWQPSPLF